MFAVPQATVTINKSRSGPVYIGTEFVLTADISLSGVNKDISLGITWSRGSDVIINGIRTTVSSVSVSRESYTASLTYSPIRKSDGGMITATVTVGLLNVYLTATGTQSLNVQGIHIHVPMSN